MTDAEDEEWKHGAPCNGLQDVFYPHSTSDDDFAEPLRICRACPVQSECFAFALKMKEIFQGKRGVWRAKHGVIAGITPAPLGRPRKL